ncbi:MAG TPA: hypothetical protein VIH97_12735 [Candidatus Acidoferrales bacterium]
MKPSEDEIIPLGNSIEESGYAENQTGGSVLGTGAGFVRDHARRILGISALVLAPCFWHRTIVADDLGSHVYNAWLTQLIRQGQAPGLWLATRWNNVLFDYLLDFLGRFFSLGMAEKISVSLSVLVFFWGVFAFVCAAARRAPWFLIPCIAMVSYGYTFHMGFLNYYISLGLSFWGVAIFWRGRGWERMIPLVLAPLIFLANPLGLVWMVAASAYIWAAERIPARYHFALVALAITALGVAHWHFWHTNVIEEQRRAAYYFSGTDQFLLFGARYWIPQVLFGLFAVAAMGFDLLSRHRNKAGFAGYGIPFQFYAILIFAAMLLPEGIRFPNQPVALAILTERLSTVTAAVLCCLLGAMVPRKWHLIVFTATAAVFFAFLYQDTGKMDRMEGQLEKLVRTIPASQRVLGTIQPFPGSRILIQHMLDRACIGYCFSYGNYEAASQQFRVRASDGNRYLMSYFGDTSDMEDGAYEVKPEDLPAWQVYQCSESGTDFCIAPLRAGQMNDELGLHPD